MVEEEIPVSAASMSGVMPRSAQHHAIRFGLIDWMRSMEVIIAEPVAPLQRPAECLMQQRLFQFVEGGELALVEGFEALCFNREGIEFCNYGSLFFL